MSPRPAASILGQQVHEAIRADIILGVHSPGAPLRLAALASQFDVSMSVVREALVRLSEQGLAVLTHNQGFRVVDVSRRDLLELTDLRVMIEGSALEDSIVAGSVQWEAQVLSAHHVLERAEPTREGEPGSTEEWSLAHEQFHDTLVSACGNNRLVTMTRSLREGAELYRQLSTGHPGRDVAGEHRELMELAIGRRADEARVALERHIRLTTTLILDSEALLEA
ncbi:GntR family transcriptional regulator [soil metagenome]